MFTSVLNYVETAGQGEFPDYRQLWSPIQGGESHAGQGKPLHLPRQQQPGRRQPLLPPVKGGHGGQRAGRGVPWHRLDCSCQVDLHYQDCQCVQPGTEEQQKYRTERENKLTL